MFKTRPENGKGYGKPMVQVFITAAAFYVVLTALMYLLQRNFLYYPEGFTPTPAQSGVPAMQTVHFTTEDGLDLFGWAQPPRDAGRPWVVIFHGNAGSIGARGFKARVFLEAGYGVLMPEFRGYGGNPGRPTEAGLFADARAALAYLEGRGVRGRGVVLYGESLGTGVAVAMAAEMAGRGGPAAAVLLEAPFTSTVDTAARHYPFLPVRLLMKDRFDSLSRIAAIEAPLFVVHGDGDWTVPQSLGRRLFAAAREPKEALWIDGAGHNDLYDFGLGPAALDFLSRQGL